MNYESANRELKSQRFLLRDSYKELGDIAKLRDRYMAQIFVSHSKEDRDLVAFFSKIFAGTKVKAIFEEFEKIVTGEITPLRVAQDIENSKAIFVILGQNVQSMPHTRDWVVWETGVAKNKDIWIFEPYPYLGGISVVTPVLRHYAVFDINDAWHGYIRRIIESYDDSHLLPALVVGGAIGAALAEKDKTGGAAVGAFAGLVLTDRSKMRPAGIRVMCMSCSSTYNIHMPPEMTTFRCPVCNTGLRIKT